MQCVHNCNTLKPKTFEQPVIQTLQMFIGEAGCWLVVFASYLINRLRYGSSRGQTAYQPVETRDDDDDHDEDTERRPRDSDSSEAAAGDLSSSQTLVDPTNVVAKSLVDNEGNDVEGRRPLEGWNVTLLALPAMCDICGTTLMNVGLLLVAASIYQMTRGALVLFVGLFSVVFLKRQLGAWKWGSLVIVVLGVAVVGLAGALDKQEPTGPGVDLPGDTRPEHGDLMSHPALLAVRKAISTLEAHTPAETVLGVFLIAGAQVFTATQFVLEESIMEKYSMDPIQVVGWEGVFGFLVTLLGIGVLHGVKGSTESGRGGIFDAREGFSQVFHNRAIAATSLLIMVSIG